MFQFYAPLFALLFPLPLIFIFLKNKAHKPLDPVSTLAFPSIHRLEKAVGATNAQAAKKMRWFSPILAIVWSLLVLSLMQPEKVDSTLKVKQEGLDLMLAVDISASMQAVDFSTASKTISRLDATKEVVSQFVLERKGDRVGLIVFGESAYLYVPLTLDTVSVGRMLNGVVSGMAGNATSIGDAIAVAVKALKSRPQSSRVLVLLTDGEDNASTIPPMEATRLAKEFGIKIYTIGIGRDGTVPVPMPGGGYGMAKVTIDEKLLKNIAEMTGGRYYSAQDKKALKNIYEKINALEKTTSEESIFLIRKPLFIYPLSLAMLLLIGMALFELKFFLRGRSGFGTQ